jgi:hypothetical protein
VSPYLVDSRAPDHDLDQRAAERQVRALGCEDMSLPLAVVSETLLQHVPVLDELAGCVEPEDVDRWQVPRLQVRIAQRAARVVPAVTCSTGQA